MSPIRYRRPGPALIVTAVLAMALTLTLAFTLAACGRTQGGTTVNVTLSEFKFDATQTTFTAGTSYHFVVTNKGNADHEFMIVPHAMGNTSMEEMHHMALAMIDKVAPGQTKTLDYTFQGSASKDDLEFACSYPGHYEAGMRQSIAVKQG